nr:MAG: hypothetical protein J07AB56_09030 [Candidatus Nanosalinarum sp. J07AB56]
MIRRPERPGIPLIELEIAERAARRVEQEMENDE